MCCQDYILCYFQKSGFNMLLYIYIYICYSRFFFVLTSVVSRSIHHSCRDSSKRPVYSHLANTGSTVLLDEATEDKILSAAGCVWPVLSEHPGSRSHNSKLLPEEIGPIYDLPYVFQHFLVPASMEESIIALSACVSNKCSNCFLACYLTLPLNYINTLLSLWCEFLI